MPPTSSTLGGISSIEKTDTEFMINYETGEKAKLNILNSHVFKYFMSPSGVFPDYPEPRNPEDIAKINSKKISEYGGNKAFEESVLNHQSDHYVINIHKITLKFHKAKGLMTVIDKTTDKEVLHEVKPLTYDDSKSKQTLKQHMDEYFFGGGMQNGRFSHKGEKIQIANTTNNWIDGGVTSPSPFYWSTRGYAILRNTWQLGIYDFGSQDSSTVTTIHDGADFDAFFFINQNPKDILNDYFELTGHPLFMPEYAFYQAHLNAFNRDYWVKVEKGVPGAILYEDGFYYKSYQPNQIHDKDGILESLNGEKNNYQFSARAMIDRYKKHDMPLAWFLPNDGYGCGYGQTDSLDGDIQNLKEFGDYARENGVELALWTESQLAPKDPDHPKKGERDLSKEVGVAGVVALKCDVAWIGHGYSFGLNAVDNATNIFKRSTRNDTRNMIMMVNGWAGTQRYSGIWSGDQKGGEWEYIRFHIPTYIGSGLAGQPVVGSDMDGISGGKSREVNIRDFQWKTFTPLQLNMDGWGEIPKYPFSFDEQATDINRAYLKLKSMFMPYNYTIGHESTHGLPMIRAMFLEFPKETTAYTIDSQYQYMWGPSILVAPIYNAKGLVDASLRDGIYLPGQNQIWIDFFTGEKYQGGKIYNNIKAPLWKIPVFIKDGAILPMTRPNNNPYEIKRDLRIFTLYPNEKSSFEVYEDDGITSHHLDGHFATTKIAIKGPPSNEKGSVYIDLFNTEGSYKKMVKERITIFQIMISNPITHVKADINAEHIKILQAESREEFEQLEDVWYIDNDFMINPYLDKLGGETGKHKFLLIKIRKTDVTANSISLNVEGYENVGTIFGGNSKLNEELKAPTRLAVTEEVNSSSITLTWQAEPNAAYYEIEKDGVIFTNISEPFVIFKNFKYETVHRFRVRSVNEDGVSKWTDFISGVTPADPFKHTVKGVKATCSVPCQPGEAIDKLTDGDMSTLWHTSWEMPDEAHPATGKYIQLNFDLGKTYKIEKMEYIPRENAENGTILSLQYTYSNDGIHWTRLSEPVEWAQNNQVKTIQTGGNEMRYVQWNILDSVSGYASGKQALFYKAV